MRFQDYLGEEAEEELIELFLKEGAIQAKGWTKDSIRKFGKTVGKKATEHGFFDACVSRMQGKEGFDSDKAKRFCASIKDTAYGSTKWRGKDKPKSEMPKPKI